MANVVVDTAYLVAMFDGAEQLAPEMVARINFFVHRMSAAGHRILIPTPALAEFLCGAGAAGPDYLATISRSRHFRVAAFDERAAVELAAHHIEGARAFGKRGGAEPDAPWQKIKIDRQIVAVATMERAATIYSNDRDIAALAAQHEIEVVSMRDLPDPPEPDKDLFSLDADWSARE